LNRFGKDNFEEAAKVSKKMDFTSLDWKSFHYMVFDVPNGVGTYADRYALLGNLLCPRLPSSQ